MCQLVQTDDADQNDDWQLFQESYTYKIPETTDQPAKTFRKAHETEWVNVCCIPDDETEHTDEKI